MAFLNQNKKVGNALNDQKSQKQGDLLAMPLSVHQESAKLINTTDEQVVINGQKSPDKKRSSKKVDTVEDQSSDDEIQMDDLGQEFTANIVYSTLKNKSDTQCEANIIDRLSKKDYQGSSNEFYQY